MFSYLPTVLSSWQLPGLAAGALSSALQRRIIFFLLKRTLGHLIKDNELKLDQIDAGTLGSKIEVRGVHLDAEAITDLLPDVPCRLHSGLVGSISIQLPWPNLMTGDLTITVSDVTLCLLVDGLERDKRDETLADSLMVAAEDAMHKDLEGIELEESIQASIDEESGTSEDQDASADGYVAKLVAGLLARLKITMNNVCVRLRHDLGTSPELQLRLETAQATTASSATGDIVTELIRTATIQGLALYLCSDASGNVQAQGDATGDDNDEDEDGDSDVDYMSMSQAIPDLRTSRAGADSFHTTFSGGGSLYQSAIGEPGSDSVRPALQPKLAIDPSQNAEELLLKVDGEHIVARFVATTLRPSAQSHDEDDEEGEEEEEGGSKIEELRANGPTLSFSLHIDVGNLVGLLTAASASVLLRFSEDCIAALRKDRDLDVTPAPGKGRRGGSSQKLVTSIAVKGVDLVCAYEEPRSLKTLQHDLYLRSLPSYWLRPSKVHPEIGHLRLRVQAFQCRLVNAGPSSTAEVSVGEMSLYEHLSPSLTEGHPTAATTLPLLLFDHNLAQQYVTGKSQARESNHPVKPKAKVEDLHIDAIDWRFPSGVSNAGSYAESSGGSNSRAGPYWKASYGDRGWKIRPKHRRTSSSATSIPDMLPALTAKVDSEAKVQVSLAPIHLFVDLSTADRVLPLLKSLGKSTRVDLAGSMQTDLTASFETLHQASLRDIGSGATRDTGAALPQSCLSLTCDLIRVEVRVPSSAPQRHLRANDAQKKRQLGLQVRAGVVIVDARSVKMHLGSEESASPKTHVRFGQFVQLPRLPTNWPTRQEEIAVCSVDQITCFYKEVDRQRATNFAVLGMLTSDEKQEKPLPPRLSMLQERTGRTTGAPRSFVDCRLPSFNVCLSKALLDGLELIADDFALWSSTLGQEHDEEDRSEGATDALKILGSRFFGTRHSVSALSGSSASVELTRKSDSMPAFNLSISESYVSLLIPRKQQGTLHRQVSLSASDLKLFIDTKHGPRSTLVDMTILSLSVDDETDAEKPLSILSRTLEQSLSRGILPMVSTQLLSTSDAETTYRESKSEVLLQGFTVTFHGDLSLLDDLLLFTRSPDGAFEHVEPNEVTRLSLRMRDVSLCIAPTSCQARAVVLLGDFALRTKLMPDAHQTTVRSSLRDSFLLVTEKREEGQSEHKTPARTSLEYWTNSTFVKLAAVNDVAGSVIMSTLTRPEVDVKVTRVALDVLACADTLTVITDLSSHVMPSNESAVPRSRSNSSDSDGRDLLASLDEDAFHRARPVPSLPDLLDDDLPRHPDFLKSDAPWSAAEEEGEEGDVSLEAELYSDDPSVHTLSLHTEATRADVVLQTEAVTIRLLDSKGICPKANYFSRLQSSEDSRKGSIHTRSPSLRVRVQGCDVRLRLYAGYDSQSTRTSVEDEARRVRRRLQKIKQMLDQGQMPDDSVEEATASLMDSIHIPLPPGAAVGDMEVGEMMQAMDDELGDQSETASSASTWKQFIPGRAGPVLGMQQQQQQKRKRSKLMRSKKSLIDVELKGISVEYDQYAPSELLASRLLFESKSLKILDNIKTSTWHTFLTEMASAHSHLSRNAKDMVKVELIHVRPSVGTEPEVRCRARLLPIRLHVDQDALDFLKKFAAFKAPNAMPEAPKPASRQPFIQHAEVFPIRLKLDYKPKRVDYNLLREGKTMELMNFFNFEGSEMTLRHVTIRGISGWTRFFDTLQDIWTPDVKSNQLADVLSGISPIRSLVNVGNGVADLILLPIEQYQRDGRLSKGLKAGAKSFVKSTMLEAARIGARLATGTQVVLEQAETALAGRTATVVEPVGGVPNSGTRSSGKGNGSGDRGTGARHRLDLQHGGEEDILTESDDETVTTTARISRYANQPDNLVQALVEAQQGLSKGFNEAAQTILAVPMEVYERRAGEGGSRPVVRAVPIAVLKGAAGASGAVSKTLQGIQRELAGASLEEEEDKYKKANVGKRR